MSRKRTGRNRGRPARSMHFTLRPIPRATPDPRKLGRAFLALAIHNGNLKVDQSALPKESLNGTS